MAPVAAARKRRTATALAALLRRAQARGAKVVFTNGCFDLVHAGHVKVLERARSLGDLLVVGLNSDDSVRRLKGPGRPLLHEQDRALLLGGLASVDYVVLFQEDTPQRLIKQLQPDVLVKGSDWSQGNIIGADIVQARGGRIVRIPLLQGRSTTRLIQRIQRASPG